MALRSKTEENIELTDESVMDEILEEEVEIILSKTQKIGALEAVLFSTGDSISIGKLAECLDISEAETEDILEVLADRYASDDYGITIVRLEDSVQLATKREYYNVLKKLVRAPRRQVLSETVLETLSIIAYKQPVTRVEVEKIRGVSCSHQINKLLEYDLIRELGHLDAPGQPLLFGTTEQFLRSFDVSSIEDLPQASPERIADFQAEAEKEVQEIKV